MGVQVLDNIKTESKEIRHKEIQQIQRSQVKNWRQAVLGAVKSLRIPSADEGFCS
jgi:hypothetical protein